MFGALIALCAAIAFGTGSVLQKVGAPPADAIGIRRLGQHVVTSPTYLLGTSLDVFGFVLTAVAARPLALFAVEGILSTGVGFTAVLAACRPEGTPARRGQAGGHGDGRRPRAARRECRAGDRTRRWVSRWS